MEKHDLSHKAQYGNSKLADICSIQRQFHKYLRNEIETLFGIFSISEGNFVSLFPTKRIAESVFYDLYYPSPNYLICKFSPFFYFVKPRKNQNNKK